MMDILSAFGLASAAGLNAYLPLLIVGLTARYTDLITLNEPWNALENPLVLGVLAVLLLIEMTVDKVPAVDTVNDILQTVVRPAAGAILFAANGNVITHIDPTLALICGLLVAGSVHAAKATARPMITASTGGIGNPVVSFLEDVVSAITTLASILVPALTALVILTFVTALVWRLYRWRRTRAPAG